MSAKSELKPSILVVEDEKSIATLLHYNLEKAGYRVRVTHDGEEAILMINESKPDLIVLDWMLPSLSGLEICTILRNNPETKHIPIIMLTARGEEQDKVMGLETGADDYVVKPFSPAEMIARINALFRRMRPAFSSEILEYAGIRMDLGSCSVTRDGKQLHLGPTEYRILQCLMEFPERVLSREKLMTKVWGNSRYIEIRTVDAHIARLRKALELSKDDRDIIKTIRSVGYSIHDPSLSKKQ
ncbi:MAG: phosphate regulon transcriptional regulator PhoB [Alphaproteobacteria bacterium]|nr:phosphate regulon transcriptional regulator PhoB [Alphaproteobacteria bacterium]